MFLSLPNPTTQAATPTTPTTKQMRLTMQTAYTRTENPQENENQT